MSLFWQISMHADLDVLLVADELINVPSFCSVQLLITITICKNDLAHDLAHGVRVRHVIARQCHSSSCRIDSRNYKFIMCLLCIRVRVSVASACHNNIHCIVLQPKKRW